MLLRLECKYKYIISVFLLHGKMVKFDTLKARFRSLGRPSGTVFVGFERWLDLSFWFNSSLSTFLFFSFQPYAT